MAFLRSVRFLAAAAIAAIAAACAPQPQAPGQLAATGQRQCFLPTQVTTFRAVDDDTINVFVRASDVYQLELSGACPDVDWSLQLAIRSTGGGSWVCGGSGAELIVPSTTGTQRCLVTGIHKLSPEAARAARGRGS